MTTGDVVAFGFQHCAQGGSTITRDGDGITVTPVENNGEIDFSVQTGEVQGIIPSSTSTPGNSRTAASWRAPRWASSVSATTPSPAG